MSDAQSDLDPRALHLAALLSARGWRLALAESCTGGWIAKRVTDVPGSSVWFDRGFVTYSDRAKTEMLGVSAALIAAQGAVSEPVVRAMAAGALERGNVDVSVAVSGIAGPGGGRPDKPVGTVWIAWAIGGAPVRTACYQFDGDREAVRRQTLEAALDGLLERLAESAADC